MSDKPDHIVWSEEKGYYAKVLPYGSDLSAPSIKLENVGAWKQSGITKINSYFDTRFQAIKKEYESMIEEYKWNEIVYRAEYNFEPVMGQTYYLYVKDSNLFLSMISPKEWKNPPDFMGAFKLGSSHKWELVETGA